MLDKVVAGFCIRAGNGLVVPEVSEHLVRQLFGDGIVRGVLPALPLRKAGVLSRSVLMVLGCSSSDVHKLCAPLVIHRGNVNAVHFIYESLRSDAGKILAIVSNADGEKIAVLWYAIALAISASKGAVYIDAGSFDIGKANIDRLASLLKFARVVCINGVERVSDLEALKRLARRLCGEDRLVLLGIAEGGGESAEVVDVLSESGDINPASPVVLNVNGVFDTGYALQVLLTRAFEKGIKVSPVVAEHFVNTASAFLMTMLSAHGKDSGTLGTMHVRKLMEHISERIVLFAADKGEVTYEVVRHAMSSHLNRVVRSGNEGVLSAIWKKVCQRILGCAVEPKKAKGNGREKVLRCVFAKRMHDMGFSAEVLSGFFGVSRVTIYYWFKTLKGRMEADEELRNVIDAVAGCVDEAVEEVMSNVCNDAEGEGKLSL